MKHKSLTDELLVVALRTGDEEAFREIYLRYWKKLYGIARWKLQSQDAVEELVQDVFLHLWERREALRINHLEAYLTTAIRYAVINHIKSTLVHEKYVDYAHSHFSDAVNTTDEELELNELISTVEQQLNDLPDKTRQIFRLNRLEYHSVKEIAFRMNLPQRTVEHHLGKAIKSLRVFLQDYLSVFILFTTLI